MTEDEMYVLAMNVKKRSGGICLFKAHNALMAVNWNEDLAVELLAEQKRLGSAFNINEFRRNHK